MSADAARRELAQIVMDKLRRPDHIKSARDFLHERQIALPMERAYYARLSIDPKFVTELRALFVDWSWTKAQLFAQKWHLPRDGAKDLSYTYDLWRTGRLRTPQVVVGCRTFPGTESHDQANLRRSGYRHSPPRTRSPRFLVSGADRLYQAIVLNAPPERIARLERGNRRRTDSKGVRRQLRHWARSLGIALPQRPSGRPRASTG